MKYNKEIKGQMYVSVIATNASYRQLNAFCKTQGKPNEMKK